MLGQLLKANIRPFNGLCKHFSISQSRNFKVTVLGAAGGIGQPMSLLLKLNPLIGDLAVYDINHTVGVAADLSHIDTPCFVSGYMCPEQLPQAISCADVVVCTAGLPRKPGMTRDDLFKSNAGIVKECMEVLAAVAPKALIAIITNPVNSIVPMVAEILKKSQVYDPKRLFGVTMLDVVRTRTFAGEILQRDPDKVEALVIAGHSAETILPLISLIKPQLNLEEEKDVEELISRIQNAGTYVVEAKAGAGSATLSMAYAGARFVDSLLKGLKGAKGVVECAYVESNLTEASFFSSPVLLGKDGVEKILPLPCMNQFELALLQCIIPILMKDIKQGVDASK